MGKLQDKVEITYLVERKAAWPRRALLSVILLTASLTIACFYSYARMSSVAQLASQCDGFINSSRKTLFVNDSKLLCLNGRIDKEMANQVTSKEITDGSFVVLNSLGGDVESAIDIAEHIKDRNVSIVVNHFCVSSCANYIFIAGKKKYVLRDSYLGFHGGPSSSAVVTYIGPPELRYLADQQWQVYLKGILKRQSALFAQEGVSESLIYTPLLYDDRGVANFEHMFWEYGPSVLSLKFGVRGIEEFKTPDDSSWLAELEARIGGTACKKTGVDVWQCKV